jgi:iron(III) transport system permease protein
MIFLIPILPYIFILLNITKADVNIFNVFTLRRIILLIKSAGLGISVAFISMTFGLFLSLFIAKRRKNFSIAAVFLLTFYMISPYIHAMSWLEIFSVGKFSFIKTGLVLSMYYLPLNMAIVLLGMNSIDNDYVKMGRIYRNDEDVFYKIILNMLKPYLLGAMSLVFILSSSDFSVPSLFQLKTYSFEIFTSYSSGADIGEVIVLSLPLIALNLAAFIIMFFNYRKMSYEFKGSSILRNYNLKLGNKSRLIEVIALALAASLIVVIFMNFKNIGNINMVVDTFYENIDSILYSIYISLVATAISLLFVLMANKINRSIFASIVLLSPMLLSGSLIGISIIGIFIKSNAYSYFLNRDILLIYSSTVKSIPIVYLVLKACFDTDNRDLIRCGRIYQKSLLHRIIKVEMPMRGLHIAGAFFFGFSYVFGEISSSILLIPPGKQLIALKIYSYLHYGSGNRISALGLIIILFFGLLTSVFIYTVNRKRRYIR